MLKWSGIVMSLLAVFASTGVLACRVSDKDLEGIHKMAVVVSLGDTFHAVFLGATAFQNKAFDVAVPEWEINKLATDTIVKAMKVRGRVVIAPLVMEGGRLDSLYGKHVSGPLSRPAFQVFLDHANAQGVDAILVVERTTSENQPYHQSGFGLFRHSMFGMAMGCPYVLFRSEVDRVSDGKVLAGQFDAPCEADRQKVDAKGSWDLYSAEDKSAIEAAVKQEVASKINLALAELGKL